MISVTEARQLIIQHCQSLQPVCLPLETIAGRILAEDIYSKIDIPNFPQSSHDGYAFNHAGYTLHQTFAITGEMAAGDKNHFSIQPWEAVRIFTGAPIPQGADTVVMQEKATVQNNRLILHDPAILPGASVRNKGAEIKANDIALQKETLLTPGAIGFLAGIGITQAMVFPAASISIIVTGNELQQPGLPLDYGQVYESNSFSLKAALQNIGITNITVLKVKDDLAALTDVLKKALQQSDMILLTGGVSVGDYDFVVKAAEDCGVKKIFHQIKQRPGKPLYFGTTEKNIVFGLPGNPSSVLTCFYQYVAPALQQMKSFGQDQRKMLAPAMEDFRKPAGLTHFMKGYFDGKTVTVLPAQESFRMSSFAIANCLVQIDEDATILKKGEMAEIYLLY